MKNLLLLLVALMPAQCVAREAVLDVFVPEAKTDFAMLVLQLRNTLEFQ